MKIFLDECIDRRLADSFAGHVVSTVYEKGWAGIKNGKLLTLAAAEFDVFLTVDRNLSFQQPLEKFDIAVLVLSAPSNRLYDLQLLVPKIMEVLPDAKAGKVLQIK